MKYAIKNVMTAIVIGSILSAQAQSNEFRVKLAGPANSQKLVIENIIGGIRIIGTNADEIVIKADKIPPIPEKAAGLKPVSAVGEDNTGLRLSLTQQNAVTRIVGFTSSLTDTDYEFQVPRNVALKINSESFNADDISIENMNGEIEVQANSSGLSLKGIQGPVVLRTLNGGVDLGFAALAQNKPSSVSSINGAIDVYMPATTPVNFEFKTINGEVYTDLDLKFDKEEKGMQHIGGSMNSTAQNAGGGVTMSFDAINGNIYIRKAK